MKKTGKRRSHAKRGRAPTSSISRALEAAGNSQFVQTLVPATLGAVIPRVVFEIGERKGWMEKTKPDNKPYIYGLGAVVAGVLVHRWAPTLGFGLALGGGALAGASLASKAGKAIEEAATPAGELEPGQQQQPATP